RPTGTAVVAISPPSVPAELGLALLHVRGKTLAGIRALEEELLQLALDRQRLADRQLPAGLHRALDVADRLRRGVRRREPPGVLHDLAHEGVAAVGVVDV